MKRVRDIGSRISFAGIGATLCIIFIVLGYFVRYISLSCTVLSSIGIMLPLTKKYYGEAVLTAIVATVIGFFIVNIRIVSFALGSGFYVVLTIFVQQKWNDKTWKILLSYIIKIGYSALVFWIVYGLLSILTIDLSKTFLKDWDETMLYVILNLLFTIGFLLYDFLIAKGFEYLCDKVKKIKK